MLSYCFERIERKKEKRTNILYVRAFNSFNRCIVYSIHFNIHSDIKKQQYDPLYVQVSLLRVININGTDSNKNSAHQILRQEQKITKKKSNKMGKKIYVEEKRMALQ